MPPPLLLGPLKKYSVILSSHDLGQSSTWARVLQSKWRVLNELQADPVKGWLTGASMLVMPYSSLSNAVVAVHTSKALATKGHNY